MRAVAEAVGVQLSLVLYHFGGKRQLLTALLEHENERLLERQRAPYAGDEPLAEKWLQACGYLGEDLRSGYVRVLWELWATGLAEPELARWRAALLVDRPARERRRRVGGGAGTQAAAVAARARDARRQRLPRCGGQLLAGMTEEEVPNLEALEACARLIERVERGASPG